MKRTSHWAIALTLAVTLTGCSSSLSKADGCESAAKYANESVSTLDTILERFSPETFDSVEAFAIRLVEIADELSQIDVSDSELRQAIKDWSDSQRAARNFYLNWSYGDDTTLIGPTFDQWEISLGKLSRICDF
jgi:hypothetical protein